jgi:hypothetical protein
MSAISRRNSKSLKPVNQGPRRECLMTKGRKSHDNVHLILVSLLSILYYVMHEIVYFISLGYWYRAYFWADFWFALKILFTRDVNYQSINRFVLVSLFCNIWQVWFEKLAILIQIYSYIKLECSDVYVQGIYQKTKSCTKSKRKQKRNNWFRFEVSF